MWSYHPRMCININNNWANVNFNDANNNILTMLSKLVVNMSYIHVSGVHLIWLYLPLKVVDSAFSLINIKGPACVPGLFT